MKVDHPLTTPFGDLECSIWINDDAVIGIALWGDVVLNRVSYHARLDAKFRDGNWHQTNLSLDRADRKETAYPWNARKKFADTVLPLLPMYATDDIVAAARAEKRRHDIAEEEETIRKAEETIRQAKERLKVLLVS